MAVRKGISPNTATGADTSGMDDDQLVQFIGVLTDRVDTHQAIVDAARTARTAAFAEGRRRTPPVIQRRMADAARMTEAAVTDALNRLAGKPRAPRKAKAAS